MRIYTKQPRPKRISRGRKRLKQVRAALRAIKHAVKLGRA
jgi:hypothetical protein